MSKNEHRHQDIPDDFLGKFLLTIIITPVILLIIVLIVLRGLFYKETVINRLDNPNQSASLIVTYVDSGILGGGTKIYLKKRILGIISRKITLCRNRCGDDPQLEWLNDTEYLVNEEKGSL